MFGSSLSCCTWCQFLWFGIMPLQPLLGRRLREARNCLVHTNVEMSVTDSFCKRKRSSKRQIITNWQEEKAYKRERLEIIEVPFLQHDSLCILLQELLSWTQLNWIRNRTFLWLVQNIYLVLLHSARLVENCGHIFLVSHLEQLCGFHPFF